MMKKFALAGVMAVLMLAMAAPAFAQNYRGSRCKNCPAPRPHYDSQELVRTTRDIDRSRVINTYSVVRAPRRVRATNHLVVRHNTIRNVGVIRHNHTIIEKEIRYRRRAPAPPVVINFVTQRYITVHRPAAIGVYPSRRAP